MFLQIFRKDQHVSGADVVFEGESPPGEQVVDQLARHKGAGGQLLDGASAEMRPCFGKHPVEDGLGRLALAVSVE